MKNDSLFQSLQTRSGVIVRNRIVMAPMTTWSSNPDATISDEEEKYYRDRVSGVGLVITGCSHVTQNGVGFTGEFGCFDDRFLPSLRRLASAAKSSGAPAVLQIFHAGSKALASLVPDIVSASDGHVPASTFVPNGSPTRALREDEILEIIAAFGAATRRAILAGFDGIEIHGAHGFLPQDFLSSRSNRRTDKWGGLLANRMRLPLAIVTEIQRIIEKEAKKPFMIGYRISPEEPGDGGLRLHESAVLIDKLADLGVDYLHVSLVHALQDQSIEEKDKKLIITRILETIDGRLPLLAAGQIRTPDQARTARSLGLAMVAVGQGLVMNPHWAELARKGQDAAIAVEVDLSQHTKLSIPTQLAIAIDSTPGWFRVSKGLKSASGGT